MFGPPRNLGGAMAMGQMAPVNVPQRPQRGLFGQPRQKRQEEWRDAAGLLFAAMRDMDGTMGRDNFAMAKGDMQLRRAMAEEEMRAAKEAERRRGLLDGMGLDPQQRALAELAPEAAMNALIGQKIMSPGDQLSRERFGYEQERDRVSDDRYADEFSYRMGRDAVSDGQWKQGFDASRSDEFWNRGFRQSEVFRDQRNQDRSFDFAANAAEAERGRPDASGEMSLRKEYYDRSRSFTETKAAFDRIMASNTESAPGQMSMIFAFMKMLDPGSTVREGEYASAENTRGVPATVVNAYNKVLNGTILNSDQIGQFKAQAAALYNTAGESQADIYEDYAPRAQEYGFDLDRTIPRLYEPYEPDTVRIPAMERMLTQQAPAQDAQSSAVQQTTQKQPTPVLRYNPMTGEFE